MNWILIALLAVAGFLLIRYGKSLLAAIGKLFQDTAASLIVAFVILVVAVLIVVLFQPQVLIGSSGVFGSNLKTSKAEANLRVAVLDPMDDPSIWRNQKAQIAAEAIASEYQLATAKNKAGISAAEADRLSHLPKGHPDRALWDKAGMDPAAGSLPPSVQAAKSTVGEVVQNAGNAVAKIDLTPMDQELSKPLGQAPVDSDYWLKQVYNMPKGVFVIPALIVIFLALVGVAKSTFTRA